MPTLPTAGDVNKAREQATKTINDAVEQARTPLMAALGAGDLAASTVVDTLSKLRNQLNERAESARAGVQDLPSELRGKLEPQELRKVVDSYASTARDFYGTLAHRGEDAFGRFRSQPQVQRAWTQIESAQGKVETAVDDARGMADDVLSRVTRRTRSAGEKTAVATEKAAATASKAVKDAAETVKDAGDDASETIEDAGSKAASTTRSTARKTANKATAAKSTSTASTSTAKPSKATANGKAES